MLFHGQIELEKIEVDVDDIYLELLHVLYHIPFIIKEKFKKEWLWLEFFEYPSLEVPHFQVDGNAERFFTATICPDNHLSDCVAFILLYPPDVLVSKWLKGELPFKQGIDLVQMQSVCLISSLIVPINIVLIAMLDNTLDVLDVI